MLADEVAVRINAMAHKADTPGRDEVEVERFGFAPSITFGLTTPTSLNLSYYHLNTEDMPDYGLPYTFTGGVGAGFDATPPGRSEEHTSELQSLMRISYAVFCLKKKIHDLTKAKPDRK